MKMKTETNGRMVDFVLDAFHQGLRYGEIVDFVEQKYKVSEELADEIVEEANINYDVEREVLSRERCPMCGGSVTDIVLHQYIEGGSWHCQSCGEWIEPPFVFKGTRVERSILIR